MLLGVAVGVVVGAMLGIIVGGEEGVMVGVMVGSLVGSLEGVTVGLALGDNEIDGVDVVGAALGDKLIDGLAVGHLLHEGNLVGLKVGLTDGRPEITGPRVNFLTRKSNWSVKNINPYVSPMISTTLFNFAAVALPLSNPNVPPLFPAIVVTVFELAL